MIAELVVLGIIGTVYVLGVFALSILTFSNIMRRQFLKASALFFVFSLISMIFVVLLGYDNLFFLPLVTTEFLLMITLFYSYLKSNVYFLSVLFLSSTPLSGIAARLVPYFEDIVVILAIYFSLYITGSILQAKSQESKGSTVVMGSFILMDISLVLEAFYILKFNSSFMEIGVSLFVLSIILFLLPFLIGGLSKNA
ncbi:MAG: hypothetical protein M0Z77_06385 [Thermoplasmatales archaeon]|nr:hypothetical protein [Candidatus Thermoplasmatota archaeon]MCL6002954.1 hypothetical protein [Candidatus Thermoplasmatota archaeon]MDA8055264.1 hypothetical protein [Thermoplasmatales archaeon]